MLCRAVDQLDQLERAPEIFGFVLFRPGNLSLPGRVLAVHDLDDERRLVRVDGEKVTLTFKEYELLRHILANAERVLSRDGILESVWGYDFEGESRTLDMHIKTLRRKLGPAGEHIKTIRNVGYKIGE